MICKKGGQGRGDRIKVPISRHFVLDHGCRNSRGGDPPRQSRQPRESGHPP